MILYCTITASTQMNELSSIYSYPIVIHRTVLCHCLNNETKSTVIRGVIARADKVDRVAVL